MINDITLLPGKDGKSFARIQCRTCLKVFEIPVDPKAFVAWRRGKLAQDAFPEITADIRELLVSGTCGPCMDKMYKHLTWRTVICGWPKSGKSEYATVLAAHTGSEIRATDELVGLPWSKQSETVAEWFNEEGPWIIEGVTVPRAIRKWRAANPDKPPPFDELVIMPQPDPAGLLPGQFQMGMQHDKVIVELMDWLADNVSSVKQTRVDRTEEV
jgi:hypothetical protein